MKMKFFATVGVAASMILGPVGRVQADAGDAIAGAIIGGILGHAIANDQARRKSKVRQSSKSNVNSAQYAKNKEVQTALNYFGYNVGTPDGALGPKSRAAISQYQATMGYPGTGQLTEFEQNLLLAAHSRALAGGVVVAQTISSHPMGIRGLLLMQRDEMAGGGTQMAMAPMVVPEAQALAPVPALPQPPAAGLLAAAPAPALPTLTVPGTVAAAAEPAVPAMPNFMAAAAPQVSLGSHCNKISLMTNANGGYLSVASMSDPSFALGEQFCLARTYAMAKSEDLQSKVAGFTPDQIAQQCAGFGPLLAPHVAALEMKGRADELAALQAFIANSGMPPAQLAGIARICLGVGYTTDSMDVAVGSALILTAMGEEAYGELVAHHLGQGFGVTANPDRSLEWYEPAIVAMQGAGAVFAPNLTERPALIRKAAYAAAGRSEEIAPAGALPQFAFATPVEEQATVAPGAAETQVAATVVTPDATNAVAVQPMPAQATATKVVVSMAKLPFAIFGH